MVIMSSRFLSEYSDTIKKGSKKDSILYNVSMKFQQDNYESQVLEVAMSYIRQFKAEMIELINEHYGEK